MIVHDYLWGKARMTFKQTVEKLTDLKRQFDEDSLSKPLFLDSVENVVEAYVTSKSAVELKRSLLDECRCNFWLTELQFLSLDKKLVESHGSNSAEVHTILPKPAVQRV
jgi:hypothetical protein